MAKIASSQIKHGKHVQHAIGNDKSKIAGHPMEQKKIGKPNKLSSNKNKKTSKKVQKSKRNEENKKQNQKKNLRCKEAEKNGNCLDFLLPVFKKIYNVLSPFVPASILNSIFKYFIFHFHNIF